MCDSTKLSYFDAIRPSKLKLHAHKRPEWFQTFIEQTDPGKPTACGSFKIVYPFGDFAVAIEKGEIPTPKVIDTMKFLPKEFQKHLTYPKEQFFTKGYTVSLLTNCPGGDLFRILFETYEYKKLTDRHFHDLARTLLKLHEYNIAVVDLKPENIMWCTCDCLAFIDLDSAVLLEGASPNTRAISTPWWDPISVIPKRVLSDFYVNDWCAFALILLGYFGLRLRDDGNALLINVHMESNQKLNYSYSYFAKIPKNELLRMTKMVRTEKMSPLVVQDAVNVVVNLWEVLFGTYQRMIDHEKVAPYIRFFLNSMKVKDLDANLNF